MKTYRTKNGYYYKEYQNGKKKMPQLRMGLKKNMIKVAFSLSRGCIYVESVLSYAWNLQRISLYTPPMRVTFPEAMHIQNSCTDVELVFLPERDDAQGTDVELQRAARLQGRVMILRGSWCKGSNTASSYLI